MQQHGWQVTKIEIKEGEKYRLQGSPKAIAYRYN
jgi:hypothetical protein